jgi:ribonuclease D
MKPPKLPLTLVVGVWSPSFVLRSADTEFESCSDVENMQSNIIETDEEFRDLCDHIRSEQLVGFDTEFVSDNTFRPVLGLLQFATRNRSAAVDPLAVTDLAPWWEIMADDETTVIVHGGQAEIKFCLDLLGKAPQRLFDIQLAEGFRGRSYPLSYSAIVRRVLNRGVDGSQTRTDWTRRPLSDAQLEYALEDVEHLIDIFDTQTSWLEKRGRLTWAEREISRLIDDICSDDAAAPWEKLPGIHKLNRRELVVLHRLAQWRQNEAAKQDRPVRRILRDDLLVDLAKRQPKTEKQALATRDLNRREYRRLMEDVVQVILAAQDIPDDELPEKRRSRREDASSEEQVVAKLLALSLSNRCAELDVAYTLVANNRDLLELVRYHRLGERNGARPRLLDGWREELFGSLLLDVMDGKIAFRVAPQGSAAPLVFE